MKVSAIGGIVTGMALGAAAVTAYGMMDGRSRRKLRSFAMRSGKMLSSKAGELFGK